jgi:HPt (histidine-containing phosphotransfer) domain-containing protein
MKPNPRSDRIVEVVPDSRSAIRSGASGELSWNKSESLARLGGDEVLFRELCGIFVDESPKLLEKLRQAIAADDPEAVTRAAHSLKGELGYLGADVAVQISQELEDRGQENNLSRATAALHLLEQAMAGLRTAMQDYMGAIG